MTNTPTSNERARAVEPTLEDAVLVLLAAFAGYAESHAQQEAISLGERVLHRHPHPDTGREAAIEVMARAIDEMPLEQHDFYSCAEAAYDALAPILQAERTRIEREAFEKAAKVAEDYASDGFDTGDDAKAFIASAIRNIGGSE